jgi:hypothetical protein
VKKIKISKKMKIAVLTFLALGVTGIAVVKIKKLFDKKADNKAKKNKSLKKKNSVIKQILKLPDDIDN